MENDPDFWEQLRRFHEQQHQSFEQKLFHRLDKLERNIMASLDALKTAVGTLDADVTALIAAQGEQVKQEDVDSVTQQVTTLDEAVKAATPTA